MSWINSKLVFLVGILLVVAFVGLVVAESYSSEDLQAELANLTQELTAEGYDWLVNYSLIKFIKYDNLMLSIDNKILSG